MKVLMLSLLLAGLVALALLVGTREYFDSTAASGSSSMPVQVELTMSPALRSLMETPRIVAASDKTPPQVDAMARDRDALIAAERADQMREMRERRRKYYSQGDPDEGDFDTLMTTDRCHRRPHRPEEPDHGDCPDMSKYIRDDEVPCWNCSLP